MKTLIESAASLMGTRVYLDLADRHKESPGALVAGYGGLPESDRGKARAVNRNRRHFSILYGDVILGNQTGRQGSVSPVRSLVEASQTFKGFITAFDGKPVYHSRGNVYAMFEDVDSALKCAVNVQIALCKRNACRQPAQHVRYRIGIDLCDIDSNSTEYLREAFRLAARLEQLVYSGGIYVSHLARDNLRDKSQFRFVSLGKRFLPNGMEPIEAFWIETDGAQVRDIRQGAVTGRFARVS